MGILGSIVDGIFGVTKVAIISGTIIVISAVGTAIYTKPTEESFNEKLKKDVHDAAPSGVKALSSIAVKASDVLGGHSVKYTDVVVAKIAIVSVAGKQEMGYLGVFGTWYNVQ